MPEDQKVADAFREVTEPLRRPAEDWQVTDAEAEHAGRRLGALEDAIFDQVVAKMATVDGGKFLRRLVTETEEEKAEVPEAIRAFVTRLAAREGAAGPAALLALRRHALGRFLWALEAAPRETARRLLFRAGGPDVVAALTVEEALRAVAEENRRAKRSLSAGLGALLLISPPGSEAIRMIAAHMARAIERWPAVPCETLARALERGAAMDHALPGYVPDSRGLPPPFGGDDDFMARLYEELRARLSQALGRAAR